MGKLADLAGHLDAGRPAAHDDEGEQFPPLLLVLGELGQLEASQDPAAELKRVVDGLHAGRPPLEVVVAEVRLVGASRDDQAVVLEGEVDVTGLGVDRLGRNVDGVHLAEGDRGVLLVTQDEPGRGRDLADGQDAGRHLVEQRLEEMVAGLGDQGHVHVRLRQALCGGEATEARADDHDAMPTAGSRDVRALTVNCFHDGTPDLGCGPPERYPRPGGFV